MRRPGGKRQSWKSTQNIEYLVKMCPSTDLVFFFTSSYSQTRFPNFLLLFSLLRRFSVWFPSGRGPRTTSSSTPCPCTTSTASSTSCCARCGWAPPASCCQTFIPKRYLPFPLREFICGEKLPYRQKKKKKMLAYMECCGTGSDFWLWKHCGKLHSQF